MILSILDLDDFILNGEWILKDLDCEKLNKKNSGYILLKFRLKNKTEFTLQTMFISR